MKDISQEYRELGTTGIRVSPIALGCWPIAGMTSLGVNDADSIATIEACFDVGVNFFDTAYSYGPNGESDRLIAQAIRGRRDQVVLATKCGLGWDEKLERVIDGRPATLHAQAKESVRRLNTDQVELLYLHAPDPKVPLSESAGALRELLEAGLTRAVGLSNASLEQLQEFAAVCPLSAFQPPYNMLQRNIEQTSLPWCQEHRVSVFVYWALLKGLLAGKLKRDHQWLPEDGRQRLPMFQGEEWQKNQDVVDVLRAIAERTGRTVAQITLNWTIHRPGITGALCGAKRPDQIRENAGAMGWRLSQADENALEEALKRRGPAVTRRAV